MSDPVAARPSPVTGARLAAALVLAGALATIAGALVFEHGFGLSPCKLCLIQRNPYYVAIPIAAVALAGGGRGFGRAALAFVALVFLLSAGLGAYHAGVEWGFWAGPSDCGGGTGPAAAMVNDFMKSLQTTKVVSCTEAAWRFLGLSLAGWNVVISLALAAVAAWGASPRPRPGPANRA